VVGSLGKALGSYGAFVCADREMARYLAAAARTLSDSTAPSPPPVAAAMASLALLRAEPRRVEKLQRNASIMREALSSEGLPAAPGASHILTIAVAQAAGAAAERALERGLFVVASPPPDGGEEAPTLHVKVMATHTKTELRQAAGTIAGCMPKAARRAAARAALATPGPARRAGGVFDGLAEAA